MARRSKFYTADSGITYRYFFSGCRELVRPEAQGRGFDHLFVVTADQGAPFVLRIFVSGRGLSAWRESEGRDLTMSEIYAVSKMRLFRAFDEADSLRQCSLDLLVDETNILELLSPLGL
jgi:hypothetical protein